MTAAALGVAEGASEAAAEGTAVTTADAATDGAMVTSFEQATTIRATEARSTDQRAIRGDARSGLLRINLILL